MIKLAIRLKKLGLIAIFIIILIIIFRVTIKRSPLFSKETELVLITYGQIETDLGDLKQGKPQPDTFTFANTGDTPLIINNVTTSCGCTTPEWPRQPIKPRKTGEIKVIYDALHTGRFIKTIRVEGNVSGGFMELTIKGQVLAKASNEPDYAP